MCKKYVHELTNSTTAFCSVMDSIDLDLDLDLDLDNYLLHPQPQHSLRIVHAFMGFNHRAIEHVWVEKVPIEDGVLRQEQLIWCIKRQQLQKRAQSHSHIHFKMRAMFLYHMDLEPEEIRELHQPHYPAHEFITPISAVDDVAIRPTIPMFAHMNALYIMYETSDPTHSLQHSQHSHTHNQSKKRIVIHPPHSKHNNKHKHTRRT